MRERLYIVRLWRTSRILFLAVALFVAGQCYFLKKEVFNFPFFVFGMYSSPVPAPDTISLPVLRINGRAYNYTCLPNWKEGFVLNGMNFYVRQLEGNIWTANAWKQRFGEPETETALQYYYRLVPEATSMARFPEWMADYLSDQLNKQVLSYQYSTKAYRYVHPRYIPTGQETILLDWKSNAE